MRGSVICRKCSLSVHKCRCRGARKFAVRIYAGIDPKTKRERQKWVGGFESVKEAEAHLLETQGLTTSWEVWNTYETPPLERSLRLREALPRGLRT